MDKVELVTVGKVGLDEFARYRKLLSQRSYKVDFEQGAGCPWRVVFFVDGEEVGRGQYQTAEQADDAGVDFMFSGDVE